MVRGDLYISLVGENGILKYKQIIAHQFRLGNAVPQEAVLYSDSGTWWLCLGVKNNHRAKHSLVDSIPYSDLVMHWNYSLLSAFPSIITKLSSWFVPVLFQDNKCYHTYSGSSWGRGDECMDVVRDQEDGHCKRNIEISDNILILLFRLSLLPLAPECW